MGFYLYLIWTVRSVFPSVFILIFRDCRESSQLLWWLSPAAVFHRTLFPCVWLAICSLLLFGCFLFLKWRKKGTFSVSPMIVRIINSLSTRALATTNECDDDDDVDITTATCGQWHAPSTYSSSHEHAAKNARWSMLLADRFFFQFSCHIRLPTMFPLCVRLCEDVPLRYYIISRLLFSRSRCTLCLSPPAASVCPIDIIWFASF